MATGFSRYRDIVFYRIWAQLKSEARQFYLGYLWFALEPLLMTGIFFLVFGVLLQSRSVEYVWFLLSGLTLWQWFESSLNESMFGLKTKLHIMAQIPLPKVIFPLVPVGTSTWRFLCVLVLLMVARVACGGAVYITWLAIPLVMAVMLGLLVGLAWLMSVAASYFEDTQKITQALVRLFFYLSGIFFTADRVPTDLMAAFYSNPLAILLQSFRGVFLDGVWPNWSQLAYAGLVSMIFMLAGWWVCMRVDKRLLKEVVA